MIVSVNEKAAKALSERLNESSKSARIFIKGFG